MEKIFLKFTVQMGPAKTQKAFAQQETINKQKTV